MKKLLLKLVLVNIKKKNHLASIVICRKIDLLSPYITTEQNQSIVLLKMIQRHKFSYLLHLFVTTRLILIIIKILRVGHLVMFLKLKKKELAYYQEYLGKLSIIYPLKNGLVARNVTSFNYLVFYFICYIHRPSLLWFILLMQKNISCRNSFQETVPVYLLFTSLIMCSSSLKKSSKSISFSPNNFYQNWWFARWSITKINHCTSRNIYFGVLCHHEELHSTK